MFLWFVTLLICSLLWWFVGKARAEEGGETFTAIGQVSANCSPTASKQSDLDSQPAPAGHCKPEKIYTGERVSLDFQNADIHNVLRIISEESGKTIVIHDAVTGKVTLKLKDVAWDQALDIVLSSRNLGLEESGNVLTVYDLAMLDKAIRRSRTRTSGNPGPFKQQPLRKRVFTPKHISISTLNAELEKYKSERGKIVAIGKDIYVEDNPEAIAAMKKAFFDIEPIAGQILLEVRFVESSPAFARQLGFNQLDGISSEQTEVGIKKEAGDANKSDHFIGDAKLNAIILNESEAKLFAASLSASESLNESRTIRAPRVMANHGQDIFIKQGRMLHCPTGSEPARPIIKRAEIPAPEIKIKPQIVGEAKLLTLDIELIKDVSNGSALTPGPNSAAVKLKIKDGEAVVIGGIYSEVDPESNNGVSIARFMPLGNYLRPNDRSSDDDSDPEIFIIITANIIPTNP